MSEFTDIHDPIRRDYQRSERSSKKRTARERIAQAVAAEREACAEIASAHKRCGWSNDCPEKIVDAIRARGRK